MRHTMFRKKIYSFYIHPKPGKHARYRDTFVLSILEIPLPEMVFIVGKFLSEAESIEKYAKQIFGYQPMLPTTKKNRKIGLRLDVIPSRTFCLFIDHFINYPAFRSCTNFFCLIFEMVADRE